MVGVVLRGAKLPVLTMYVVFDRPWDYPDSVVVRRMELSEVPVRIVDGPIMRGPIVAIGTSIEEVREKLPRGLTRLPRHPTDVASLVETWI